MRRLLLNSLLAVFALFVVAPNIGGCPSLDDLVKEVTDIVGDDDDDDDDGFFGDDDDDDDDDDFGDFFDDDDDD